MKILIKTFISILTVFIITGCGYREGSDLLEEGVVNGNGNGSGEQIWFDTNWHYRQKVEINNTVSDLTDYQVELAIDNTNTDFWGNVENDGRSIRFTDSNSTTPINFWVETWDFAGKSATIRIEVPDLPTGTKSIYIYYSNSAATNESNAADTLIFYDDFSSDTMANYTEVLFLDHGGGLNWQISSGNMTSESTNACEAIYFTSYTGISNIYIETYELGAADDDGYGIYIYNGIDTGRVAILSDGHPGVGGYYTAVEGADISNLLLQSQDGNTNHPQAHKIALAIDQNEEVRMWKDDIAEFVPPYNDAGFNLTKFGLASLAMQDPSPYPRFDYLLVRQYVNPEPSTSTGAQETVQE